MSYTPTEWKTGDVITADKLNNMESGIVNAEGGSGATLIKVVENYKMYLPPRNEYAVWPYLSGGGGFIGDKTLGELVGNKTIIGFYATATYEDYTYSAISSTLDIPLFSPSDYKQMTACSYYVDLGPVAATIATTQTLEIPINIYAICI